MSITLREHLEAIRDWSDEEKRWDDPGECAIAALALLDKEPEGKHIDHTHPDWQDSSEMSLDELQDPSRWPAQPSDKRVAGISEDRGDQGVSARKASPSVPSELASLGSATQEPASGGSPGTSRADALADKLAGWSEEHYRFTKATRKEVAVTAVRDLLDELMPIVPILQRMVDNDERPKDEHNAICQLLEYLRA